MTSWVYDIETYPNIFTLVAVEVNKKEAWVFEISDRKNQIKDMVIFLRRLYKDKDRMIGFNNVGFDYPVLHYILKNQNCSVKDIYNKAMSIIKAQNDDDKFANIIPDKEVFVPQIDLFKIHHFDNLARATSLKVIEFNMRSANIEDLPFDVGTNLNDEQKDVLIKYNKHDVMMTLDFFYASLELVKFRETLSIKYNRNFMNHNDTKIGKDYFIMRLEEAQKGICYDYSSGRRKIRQTRRKTINLSECILPYVKFNRPEFKAVLEWLKTQTISETKGVFSDLNENILGDVAKYAGMKQSNTKLPSKPTDEETTALLKTNPCSWIEERPLKSGKNNFSYYHCWNTATNLNVIIDGFRYDFGTGGIHGSLDPTIVKSNEDYLIVDWDVASYYPNLAIKNRVYPEHLSELFCDIYEDVYNQRKSFAKGTAENAMMKLALNGVYGDSNSQFSPFFDPKYTMTITINGQLSLCMLAEELLTIEGLSLIQCNTDGITVRVPRKDIDRHVDICKEWMRLTKLELERNDYNAMYIRDVNNYVAVYTNGEMKRKGAYEYEGLEWNKNHSSLVIQMAAVANLVEGRDIEEFIRNHSEKMDFMLRVKVPRSSKLLSVDGCGFESREQNICRYYASVKGVELVKVMPPIEDKIVIETTYRKPETGEELTTTKKLTRKGFTEIVKQVQIPPEERRIGIAKGQKVVVCNDIKRFSGDIDYDYYISEAKKLVEELTNG